MKRLAAPILGIFVLCVGVLAVAQQSSDGPYVLHEFFEGNLQAEGQTQQQATRNPRVPGAPPSLSMEKGQNELVYGADGPLKDARLQEPYGELSPFGRANTLDKNTDRVDNLNYFASFEPSVIPYKRVVAQNRVVYSNGTYMAQLEPGRRRPEPLQGLGEQPSETFWGTFMFRSEANRFMPVASVSPDQRVLDVRTEPPVPVEVFRDDAGNFMIRTPHDGLLRVNMQVAVPTFYFNGTMDGVTWSDVNPQNESRLPTEASRVADRVLKQIGVDRRLGPGPAIKKMVEYFRDFEAKPFPDELNTGDLYESIASNQIGVCRHRSLAFMVTAQALGFRTHYVYNEAHAFVEVYWPGSGWRRIDLGGAADQMNAAANDDRDIHSPGDSLPQPERFLEEQERMVQNGWKPPSEGGANGGNGNAANGSQGTNNAGGTDGAASNGTDTNDTPPETADTRQVPRLQFLQATRRVKRGGVVSVEGRLTDPDGRPIIGETVEVHLGAVGSRNPSRMTKLADLRTDSNGFVRGDVTIPTVQAIGRWSMFLYYAGGQFAPIAAE